MLANVTNLTNQKKLFYSNLLFFLINRFSVCLRTETNTRETRVLKNELVLTLSISRGLPIELNGDTRSPIRPYSLLWPRPPRLRVQSHGLHSQL